MTSGIATWLPPTTSRVAGGTCTSTKTWTAPPGPRLTVRETPVARAGCAAAGAAASRAGSPSDPSRCPSSSKRSLAPPPGASIRVRIAADPPAATCCRTFRRARAFPVGCRAVTEGHRLDEDLDGPPARETDLPGVLVPEIEGEQLRPGSLEHALGLGHHLGVHAAPDRHRAEDPTVLTDPHLRPLLARSGAVGADEGGERRPTFGPAEGLDLVEDLAHAAYCSSEEALALETGRAGPGRGPTTVKRAWRSVSPGLFAYPPTFPPSAR